MKKTNNNYVLILLKIDKKSSGISVELDTKQTPELEAEGYAREFARNVQSARKKEGLERGQLIELKIKADDKIKNYLKQFIEFLKERTNSNSVEFLDNLPKITAEFNIKENKISVFFVIG